MKDIYKKQAVQVKKAALEAIKKAKDRYKGVCLVMAPIFTEENIGEGYIQRVKAIDDEVLNETFNIYVDFETKNTLPTITLVDDRHMLITMMPFSKNCANAVADIARHCNIVYTHSVMRAMPDIQGEYVHNIYRQKNVFYVWDVHGSVPEEFALSDNYYEAQNAGAGEELFINTANIIITVNHAMKRHLEKKYSRELDNVVVLPIFHLGESDPEQIMAIKRSVFYPMAVYAGGVQEWQNIPLMQKTVQTAGDKYGYKMFISKPDEYLEMWKDAKEPQNYYLGRKSPAEVVEEYKACHFGFALRDDITVNNVACPTKIIEYIQYGIVPVLKTEKIGDFVDMGMQYISYEEFADSAPGFEQYSSMARGNFAVLDKLMQAHNDGVAELKGKLYEKFNV